MEKTQIFDDAEWSSVLALLPSELEKTALEANALARRRNIPNAAALIRIALAYAVSDLSLKDVAAWATSSRIAKLTGPALFYRLRKAENWLQVLLAEVLTSESLNYIVPGYKLRVVDATVVNGPKSDNIDWRVHLVGRVHGGGVNSGVVQAGGVPPAWTGWARWPSGRLAVR